MISSQRYWKVHFDGALLRSSASTGIISPPHRVISQFMLLDWNLRPQTMWQSGKLYYWVLSWKEMKIKLVEVIRDLDLVVM